MLAVLVLCLVLLGDSTTDAETECGPPPDVQGALPEPEFRDITRFQSGATIQYRCDVKHYLVELTSWSRTCSDGEWGEVQFRCIVKSCPAINTPDNGQRMDFNYEVGTFAKFECNTGYEMVGVAQLLCRTDMEWSPKDPPTCKPVRCPDESYLANGRVVQETYRQEKNTFGITNRYYCNSGYVLKGPSTRTCQASRSWSGTKPICDMPRCPDMRVENGEIKYIGDRARYTYAHVNCNDGYTVGKDGVETVECLGSLQWESILHCYKTLKPWKPDNSRIQDLGNEEEDLEHHETYKIRCNWRYEMKLEHGHYLGGDGRRKSIVEVENLKGALKYGEIDAYTLSCVGKRCFQIDKSKYPNVVIQPKTKYVEHGQSYHLSCENGYEHSLESDPDWTCSYGRLQEIILKCTEKPCDTPKIENGVLRSSNKVYSKPTIVSRGSVSLQCSEGFFLYDNSKYDFMKEHEFHIKCDRGNITSIPSCKKASRCELPNDPYASYYVNDEIYRNNTISHEDEVDRVECEEGTSLTKPLNGRNRCWDGDWKLGVELPVCEPDPCRLIKEKGRRFMLMGTEVKREVAHGNKMNVVCDEDYDMDGNDEDSNSEIQCLKGRFDKMHRCVERCTIPDIPNAIITRSNSTHPDKLKHEENVSVSCEEEFLLYDNNKKFIEEGSFIMTCASGNVPSIPSCRKALNCSLPRDPYALYYVNGEKHIGDTILHESKVHVECENGTSLIVSSDDVRTCWNGDWKSRESFPVCVQGCAIPDISNATITRSNVTHTDKLKHGENITVTCHEGYSIKNSEVDDYNLYPDYPDYEKTDALFTLTCNNGTIENKQCEILQESIDQPENIDPTIKPSSPDNETTTAPSDETTSPIDNGHGVLNCTIPESTDVHFVTLSGEKLKEGTKIPNGKKFIAEKECKDYYEGYYLDYDDVDGEEISPPIRPINKIVNCTDGVLSDYTLVCDDVDNSDTAVTNPEGCMTVQNGIVTDNGQSVECNEGYVNAHSLLYERYSCSCDRDIPALVCNGRKAKCNPVNCTLDSPIEQGMTLNYKGRFVTASSIEAIGHGESVTFNCEIGANDIAYEPRRRLFKCDRGKWIEKNRKVGSWSLGNNGTFPKCRPAKCQCQYGGTCYRDEKCTCPKFSTGQQCETPVCPNGCQNGGTCTSPKMCSCPKGFSGNRCQTEEGCQAPIDIRNYAFYRNGATYTVTHDSCSDGYIPSYKGQITCVNGHWSEKVICLKGARYRITVKTADKWFAGTNGEAYFYMYGSIGNSDKIILHGEFEAGDEDLTVGDFVDVGKIFKIQLGVKARSLTRDGWIPESVLIEDVSRGDYYKFVNGAEIDDTSIFLYPAALCDVGCQNGGTCSAPNRCSCPDGFFGNRCETALCSGGCQNRGTCTSPNKCSCPAGFSGSRCETFPMRPSYRIRVKTADFRIYDRAHKQVFIKIHGSKAITDWEIFKQVPDRGKISEERLIIRNIGQIEQIDFSVGSHYAWKPEYVTIHVEDTDDFYVFRYSGRDFFKYYHFFPEGHCSRPFTNRPLAKELRGQIIQNRKARDETDCQIQCLEHPQCKMIMFNSSSGYCTAYDYGQTRQWVDGIVYELLPCYGRNY